LPHILIVLLFTERVSADWSEIVSCKRSYRKSSATILQGSTLEKKPWGQLAPKSLDLVASTIFLVGKKFSALRAKDFYLKISFDTVKLRLLFSLPLSLFIAYHFA